MLDNAWLAWLILGSPLIAFVLVGLFGKRLPEGGAHVVVGSFVVSLVLALYFLIQVIQQGAIGGGTSFTILGFSWVPADPTTGEGALGVNIPTDSPGALMLV